jgi:hypothetical protein
MKCEDNLFRTWSKKSKVEGGGTSRDEISPHFIVPAPITPVWTSPLVQKVVPMGTSIILF